MSSISRSILCLGVAAVAGTALVSDASAFGFRGFGGGHAGGFGGGFGGHPTIAMFHPGGFGHGPILRGPIVHRPIAPRPVLDRPVLGRPVLGGPILGGPVRMPPVGRPPRWPRPIPVRFPWPRLPGPHLPPVYVGGHGHLFPILPVGLVAAPVAVGTGAASVATAPAPSPAVCGATAGSFVSVVFVPTVTAADITAFLKAYNVTMADGPNDDGTYRIRLSDAVMPSDRIAEILDSMRKQTAIISSVDGA